MEKIFLTLALCMANVLPTNSYAAFVEYIGSGTLQGQAFSMSIEIDNEISTSGTWRTPDYYNSIGAHPRDMILGGFNVGRYTIELEGAGTTPVLAGI